MIEKSNKIPDLENKKDVKILAEREVIPGLYHYQNGDFYRVHFIANDCEDKDGPRVFYEAMYGDHDKWYREVSRFNKKVDRSKYPHVRQQYAYHKIFADIHEEIRKFEKTNNKKVKSVTFKTMQDIKDLIANEGFPPYDIISKDKIICYNLLFIAREDVFISCDDNNYDLHNNNYYLSIED